MKKFNNTNAKTEFIVISWANIFSWRNILNYEKVEELTHVFKFISSISWYI